MKDLARVAQAVAAAAQGPAAGLLNRLCAACSSTLPVEGVAISMMAQVGRPMARSASDERVTRLEELQFTLGEGPGIAAYTSRAPAWTTDLLQVDSDWPVFAAEAAALVLAAGWEIRSMVAFPLQLGREPLGIVDLYRRHSGDVDPELIAQARIAVDAVALALLAAVGDGEGGPAWLPPMVTDEVTVDQAVGMVMAQLDLGPEAALARLRAHAFAQGQMLGDVAAAVVSRALRLTREDG
ncbi:ANTAR domain-containing protein [Streptacidiphilus sp. PAMC 29251]